MKLSHHDVRAAWPIVLKLLEEPLTLATQPMSNAGAAEWLASAASPHHWVKRIKRRQLKQQYLDELFTSDASQGLKADSALRSVQVSRVGRSECWGHSGGLQYGSYCAAHPDPPLGGKLWCWPSLERLQVVVGANRLGVIEKASYC